MNQIWKHVLLGEVFESITNGVNCDQKSNTGKQLVTRIETISKGVFNLERIGRADLTEKDLSKYRMKENDILFSHINSPIHVGKTALFEIDEEVYHGVNLLRIRTIKEVEPKFLRYFLLLLYTSGFWRTVAKQSVNQASVNQKDISAVPFSYPTLEKQREIVKKLDSAFAEVELLEENLGLSNENAIQLQGSLLSASFSPAKVKLELSNSSANQESLTWQTTKLLGEICEISTGSTDTKDATENGLYPLFDRSKKIKRSDKYLFDCEALIIPGEGAEFLPRHYIGKFDLHQRAYAMFNFSNLVDPLYLYYYLISVKDYFANNAVGATVKSLRRRHFTDLEIPLPSLSEQRAIVKKLESVFEETEALKSQIKRRTDYASALCQSLLSDAFINEEDVA